MLQAPSEGPPLSPPPASCHLESDVLPKGLRPTVALVDLDAFAGNCAQVRSLAGSGVRLLAVVKADGYGHGAEEMASRAVAAGAEMLGVGVVEEGWELRRSGVLTPVLVLGGALPEQAYAAVSGDFEMVICDLRVAEALSEVAGSQGKTLAVHVKVDTGMGRLGVALGEARSFLERLAGLPGLAVRGLMTHLADAEVQGGGAETQMSLFRDLARDLDAKGLRPPLLHVANSAALLNLPDSRFDMVRVGILLYGAEPAPGQGFQPSQGGQSPNRGGSTREVSEYLPVMFWRSRIVHLNEAESPRTVGYGRRFQTKGPSRIAIIPMGYADGYPRSLTNKADVLIRGQRAPVVGAVSMDMLAASVGHTPGVEVGDEVILLGSQGDERISAEEMASLAETLPYEIFCGLSRRVPRVYLEGGKVVRVSYPDVLSPETEGKGASPS